MKKASDEVWGFFHIQSGISNLPGSLNQVQHCTWLGSPMAVPSGHNTAMGERPGADNMGGFFIYPRTAPTLPERLSRVRKYLAMGKHPGTETAELQCIR